MEWISVEDRLPDGSEDVLCFCYDFIHIANCGIWNKATNKVIRVWTIDGKVTSETPTHWSPLLDPPT